MRAVLDVNVVVSAVLAPSGAPARILRACLEGSVDLVASPALLDELVRVLDYPKIRARVPRDDAAALVGLVARTAVIHGDPPEPFAVRSEDPDDDYLVALAAIARAVLVSGDRHLLALADRIPVLTPAEFVETHLS